MEKKKLKAHLKQRIGQCETAKMDEGLHKVDRIFANGKASAFKEMLAYAEGEYYIDKNGMRQQMEAEE